MKRTLVRGILVAAFGLFATSTVLAAGMDPRDLDPAPLTKKGSGKDFSFTIPVFGFGPQFFGRLEFNVASRVALGLEVSVSPAHENLADREIESTGGDSLVSSGREASLLVSRYSQPTRLAGFFWTLGGGYRQSVAHWSRTPPSSYSIDTHALDEDNRAAHYVRADGAVVHARAGYRYVFEALPLHACLRLGYRHFEAKVSDVEVTADEAEGVLPGTPLSTRDRKGLEGRWSGALLPELEVGFVF